MRSKFGRRIVGASFGIAFALLLAAPATGISAPPARPAASRESVRPVVPAPRANARSTSGAEAVAALGTRLPAVARNHGWTAKQLTNALRSDPTLRLDSTDRLAYVEPVDTAALAAAAAADVSPAAAAPFPLAQTFTLHSLPGANLTLLLDFDGMTLSGDVFTDTKNLGNDIVAPPFSLDADPLTFNDAERTLIQEVWQRVAEDYAPFNVDVTTEFTSEAKITRSSYADNVYGTRVLISPIHSYFGNFGGYAYIGVFDLSDPYYDYYKPALVFPEMLSNSAKTIGEAASHEAGHNLALEHDGTSAVGYYAGSGTGDTGWAPIMGNSYGQNLTQWSRGEYPDANQTQDDMAILNGYLATRPDDAGNTTATAAVLPVGTTLSASGLVASSVDTDVYRFVAGPGAAVLGVSPATVGPDLDVLAELRDSNGTLLASNNPADTLSASLGLALTGGTYYLSVRGTGKGLPTDVGGYSNYACVGRYTLTGSVPAPTITVRPVPVTRVAGADRYDVAANLARKGWDSAGNKAWAGVNDVIIASGEDRAAADPLAAAGLAGVYGAPILLVKSGATLSLPAATSKAIAEIAAQTPSVPLRIHMVGGAGSVPDATWNRIRAIAGVSQTKDRIGGLSRYEVSANIARRMVQVLGGAGITDVLIICADNPAAFYDALAVSPVAYNRHMPMIGVRGTVLEPAAMKVLQNELAGRKLHFVNSSAYVSHSVKVQISGSATPSSLTTSSNRYLAARQISETAVAKGWSTVADTGIAAKLPDALTGGTYLGKRHGVLLFTDSSSTIQSSTKTFITARKTGITGGWVIGGTGSIPSAQETSFRALVQ